MYYIKNFFICQCSTLSVSGTVESSILVEDQGSWLSWVTLAHKFTSQWTYIQVFVQYLIKLFRSWYQRNYVPTNQKNFGRPRTLTPTNKKWFHSIYPVRYNTMGKVCWTSSVVDVDESYTHLINFTHLHRLDLWVFDHLPQHPTVSSPNNQHLIKSSNKVMTVWNYFNLRQKDCSTLNHYIYSTFYI